MKRLLAAGLLYLIGIAILLAIKPSLMFTEDGSWKEFGIGRNPNTHTWLPFWLFAIFWAFICYILAMILFFVFGGDSEGQESAEAIEIKPSKKTNKINIVEEVVEMEPEDLEVTTPKPKRRSRSAPMELPDGYYVLNRKATEAAGGIPKYIYLGKGMPEE